MDETANNIYFYSNIRGPYKCFSNFYATTFLDGDIEYKCSEQYFMKKKQELFDPLNIELGNLILGSINPAEIKKYGRQVKNYNEQQWNEVRYNKMVDGLKLKFNQNEDLKRILLSTQNKNIYEASPYDNIWGTGYNIQDTYNIIENKRTDIKLGRNLLGRALMDVREWLRT